MRLELGRRAQADLDDIGEFGTRRFGPERAIAYLDRIEQAFRRLVAYPEIGAVHPARPDTRSLRCERHRIFYELDGEAIRVLRVLHETMDVGRHL